MRRAFASWRDADPAHARAFAEVEAARRAAGALADQPSLVALREETLGRATLAPAKARLRKRAIAFGVLGIAAAPLAAWGISAWALRPAQPTVAESFRTGIGDRAEVTLPGGSRVLLDTDSQLRVRIGADGRHVSLDGQGWFQLKPAAQPLLISAGGFDMVANGGQFDVRTDRGRLRAFAADGELALRDGDGAVVLRPGRLLDVRGSELVIRPLARPLTFTGWRTGMLEFENLPLRDAVGELNRYRRRPIRIADERAAAVRVSGTFRIAETPAFVDAVTSGFPVRVQAENRTGIVIASR